MKEFIKNDIVVKNETVFSKEAFYAMQHQISKRIYGLVIAVELVLIGISVFCFINKQMLLGGLLVALIVAYPLVLFLANKRQVATTYLLNKDSIEGAVYTFEFSNEILYVSFKTKNSEAKKGTLKISTFHHAIENKKYIFIFVESKLSYVLEKDKFENEFDLETLRSILKNNGVKYLKVK